jgi:hypothetical protein
MTSGDGNSGAGPAEGWLLKLGLILASHGSVVLAGWLLIRFMRKKSEG